MPHQPDGGDGRGVHGRTEGGPADQLPKLSSADGVPGTPSAGGLPEKRPHLGGGWDGGTIPGVGVHAGNVPDLPQGLPRLADACSRGRGVHDDNHLPRKIQAHQRVDLHSSTGQKVHANSDADDPFGSGATSHVSDFPGGTCAARRAWLVAWFSRLRDRLRTVRVCSGHWLRVCDSESVTTRLGTTGLFIDAPYRTHLADGSRNRAGGLYATDGTNPDEVVDEVIAYCLERGNDPRMRIAACGYAGEGYEVLVEHGWEEVRWRAQGGYSNRNKENKNRDRERIWFSPHCNNEPTLFDHLEDTPCP